MEDVRVNDSRNISGVGYAWQWKWTGIAVTNDNSWVVIGISAVSGDVASLEYVENMISGCKDEQVSSAALTKYHNRLITDNNCISELLLADHNIEMK